MTVRTMQIEDYEGVHELWMTIKGFGIRSIDDSKEGVERFLKRNPTTSVVASVCTRDTEDTASEKRWLYGQWKN